MQDCNSDPKPWLVKPTVKTFHELCNSNRVAQRVRINVGNPDIVRMMFSLSSCFILVNLWGELKRTGVLFVLKKNTLLGNF